MGKLNKEVNNNDILPNDVWKWNYIEEVIRKTMDLYNFKEIRTSIIQTQELFKTYQNYFTEEESTSNQLIYNLNGVSNLSLRPEGTITVLHSILNNNQKEQLSKLYYIGPMFRKSKENQLLQFHQFGAEIIGINDLLTDNEIILLAISIFKNLEIYNYTLELGSFGCKKCRNTYLNKLNKFIKEHKDEYCPECSYTIKQNPLQIYQCKQDQCTNISMSSPSIIDYLCDDCANHFKQLQKMLSNLGVRFSINSHLQSAFNYYNRTIFSFSIEDKGETLILANGGRYDFLASSVLKKESPAIGFSANIENIVRVMEHKNIFLEPKNNFRVLISPMASNLEIFVLQIVQELHENNVHTHILNFTENHDNMVKLTIQHQADIVIYITEELIREGKLLVNNNLKNHQEPIQIAEISNYVLTLKKSTTI
ncbi:MAG: ATP phosphoribosyltransferase regulatory subunit [Candidatus Cloacimonadales bacterium]|jgi:histidyl-tRNA synthetase|nr:ATP phosphoribosyltransferase regulatory subunit [Candidatus Cloacimonadota bacterium]MDD2650633.1 ATP phosphoribosyltransferase regulatory subunit [Candidatus Cloacimonadota bacterium]MDX9976444.1 ATP phosphoribosyltransferase regulatory subunit [Candidatus Cloacimonadales bacterium]